MGKRSSNHKKGVVNMTQKEFNAAQKKLGVPPVTEDWEHIQGGGPARVNRDKKRDKETWVDRAARAYPGALGRFLCMKGY